MREITLEQKESIHNIIEHFGFNLSDFIFIDKHDEPSFRICWTQDYYSYQFKIYYPSEYKNGYIYLDIKKGNSKNNHKLEIKPLNLDVFFTDWIVLIQRQIILNQRTSKQQVKFSECINIISEKFETIYLEAFYAEKAGLNEICGMGYRKAFEFLLIDYLLFKGYLKDKEEAKKISALKDYINFLKDETVIHSLLKYTAYVGNEFCHYFRKHEAKEFSDLKEMIQIIVEWIETKEKLIQIEGKSKSINSTF